MSSITALLRGVPLLRELSETDLSRLAMATTRLSFEAGRDIVRIGDAGHSLFVVLEGSVRVLYPARNAEFELARLGVGEFFGEMAILNDRPRSATVRSAEPVELLALEKDAFRNIALDAPALALHLLEALSLRIRNTDEHVSGLADKVMLDPLTGLLNRRAFQDRLAEEVDRTRRYGTAFSLVLADLDRFASVNDTLGHDRGDDVLRWIGRLFMEHTRASDCPFRVGGEEFAVLCPATALDTARTAARRLVDTVAEARSPVDGVHITVSAGYASCPDHGADFEDLYHMADQALLRAKTEGPGQVGEPHARM